MSKSRSKVPTIRPANTLAEFIDQVEQVVDFLDPIRDVSIWFRGHAEEVWSLTPKLYREENNTLNDIENDLRDEWVFRSIVTGRFGNVTAHFG